MTQAADYDELLYGLERVRAGDIETGNAARRRFDEDRAAVNEVVATAESIHAELTAGASTLRAGVPDLRGPVDPAQAAPVDLAAELTAAKDALAQAERHRKAAMKAAQLPPFLPRAPAWVRNLLVYVTAMVPAVFAQVVLTRLTENGQLSESMTTWFIVMPPVVFLVAGYVATAVAGTPRIPMTDRKGEPIPFTVYRSPRLGTAVTVVTTVGFLLWYLGVL
ncbi:MAG TPA: hypothetical protein H9881_01335 [Candidatus Stackebrandtia excrementipullorum]|nr:hypothetical protein [Candidatus Stackebrandtia excrementipullorum]